MAFLVFEDHKEADHFVCYRELSVNHRRVASPNYDSFVCWLAPLNILLLLTKLKKIGMIPMMTKCLRSSPKNGT